MGLVSDGYEELAARWARRQIRVWAPTPFTGALDHEIIVPGDRAGRPEYRLVGAGASRVTRLYLGHNVTQDFMLRVGPIGHATGMCSGNPRDRQAPSVRAELAVEHATVQHGSRCLVEPEVTELAGEPAVTFTLEIPSSGMHVTNTFFDREGWAFTAGLLLFPSDPPEARELGEAVLATWTWVPRSR